MVSPPPQNESADIVKPLNDSLSYRAVTLDNGIQVLLVHDADTDKAAAAMDVRVGHFSDPWEVPGLAHFLEHMLFYSSDKYPTEDEYSKFLSDNGGHSNAYTASESTNYHFDVKAGQLEPALDRFAQFFIAPQISEGGVSREMNAVDSENGKNLNTDAWRFRQLLKHLSAEGHIYHKFGTGNLETLDKTPREKGINTHQELIGFYQRHYSANLMRLVVYGKEGLDELDAMVREKFAPVVNKELPVPVFDGGPFKGDHLGALIRAVPTKEGHSMKIQWAVPPQQDLYRKCACHYLGHLLGHEGPGSIFALLKQLGWASVLYGGHGGDSYSGQSFFELHIDLTESGQEHVGEVFAIVFKYIDLVKVHGVQRWIYDEIHAVDEMRFNYRDKLNPYAYASALSAGMQVYDMRDWLLGPYAVPQEFDPNCINEVLAHMSPEGARVLWVSKAFEAEAAAREPWYGTAYAHGRIPAEWFAAARAGGGDPRLALPEPNPYVPTNFGLMPPVAPEGASAERPALARRTDLSRLWYKPDTLFQLPKGVVYIDFSCPESYFSPETSVLTRLFTKCLVDRLNEVTYYAEIANLSYVVTNTTAGFQMYFSGYSDKLLVLVHKILEYVSDYKVDDERFEAVRERVIQDYRNVQYDQPYQRAMYATSILTEHRRWHVDEYVEVGGELTAADLRAFARKLTSRSFAECLVMGNVTLQAATELAEHVEGVMRGPLRAKPLFQSQHGERRVVSLSPGVACWKEPLPNFKDENSALELTLQIGPDDPARNVLGQLWVQVANRDAFQQLRTQEQLGYMVFVITSNDHGVRSVKMILQSTAYSAGYLEERVELFLSRFGERLSGMGEEEFKEAVDTLVAVRQEKLKTVTQEARRYWGEIEDGTLRFYRVEEEVAALRRLTLADLRAFHADKVSAGGAGRCGLSVFVEAQTPVEERGEGGGGKMLERAPVPPREPIADMWEFKRSQGLFASRKNAGSKPAPPPAGTPPPAARASL